MRKRLFPTGAALALVLGLLTAGPASAVYADPTITFPDGTSTFYSPFSGPATVTFTFDSDSSDATFELRLRPQGGAAIHTKQVFIDPDTQTSPRDVSFSWPALSVTSVRTYTVAVYRGGNLQGSPESFLLRPPLASITRIAPNPFFPLIDDGYKDTTTVTFRLLEQASAEARVYRAKSNGNCCGTLVRDDASSMNNLSSGSHTWVWDGRNNNGDNAGVGRYFVRIRADDGTVRPTMSKPFRVRIERTYRATATKSKSATNYHHHSASIPLVIGGACRVTTEFDHLKILCQGGHISVYWRWGLGASQRIDRASFVFEPENAVCPPSIRRVGHSDHESSFTVHEDLAGSLGNCLLVTARITYSFPKAS